MFVMFVLEVAGFVDGREYKRADGPEHRRGEGAKRPFTWKTKELLIVKIQVVADDIRAVEGPLG